MNTSQRRTDSNSSRMPPSLPRPHRVLVVEDDVTIRPILERMLDRVSPGVVIDWAVSAEAALEHLARNVEEVARSRRAARAFSLAGRSPYYSVILSDIRLAGEKSGFDLVEDCYARGIPARFVLASGRDSAPSVIADSRDDQPFLAKPFRLEQVRALVGPYLEENRMDRWRAVARPEFDSLTRRAKRWIAEQRRESPLEWLTFFGAVAICASLFTSLPGSFAHLPFAPFPSASALHARALAVSTAGSDPLFSDRCDSEERSGCITPR